MAIGPEMLAGELIWQTHTDFSTVEWVMTVRTLHSISRKWLTSLTFASIAFLVCALKKPKKLLPGLGTASSAPIVERRKRTSTPRC
jgi:hypothetical protein